MQPLSVRIIEILCEPNLTSTATQQIGGSYSHFTRGSNAAMMRVRNRGSHIRGLPAGSKRDETAVSGAMAMPASFSSIRNFARVTTVSNILFSMAMMIYQRCLINDYLTNRISR